MIDSLNRYLLSAHAQGRRVVLIVDEAQNLQPEVLEQVRLLTNLETESQKLLQIILIGQPELRELLARNDLRQLAQRVTARYHLAPLTAEETAAYVRHRLRIAGATSEIFGDRALREVYRLSGGVPRVINVICDRALLGAYTHDQHEVTAALVRQAGSEIFGQRISPHWLMPLITALSLAGLIAVILIVWKLDSGGSAAATPAGAATSLTNQAQTAGASAANTAGTAASDIRTDNALATEGPVVTALSGLLQQSTLADGADAAIRELLKLWGATPAPDGVESCGAATRQGLECVTLHSTLAQVRELNRPAVLVLSDDQQRAHNVVLTQLEDEHARLRIGALDVYVSIAELSRYWFGDLVLVWRTPAAIDHRMSLGSRGPAVQQLRERLLRWNGTAPPKTGVSNVFDADLKRLVEQFQLAHHLTADGAPGLETQLLLDSALAIPDSPQLRKTAPQG